MNPDLAERLELIKRKVRVWNDQTLVEEINRFCSQDSQFHVNEDLMFYSLDVLCGGTVAYGPRAVEVLRRSDAGNYWSVEFRWLQGTLLPEYELAVEAALVRLNPSYTILADYGGLWFDPEEGEGGVLIPAPKKRVRPISVILGDMHKLKVNANPISREELEAAGMVVNFLAEATTRELR